MSNKTEIIGYLKEHLKNTGLTYNKIAKLADIPVGTARSALQGSSSSYENAAKIAKYVLKIPFFGLFLKPDELAKLGKTFKNGLLVDEFDILKELHKLKDENLKLKIENESYHQELRYLVKKVRKVEEQFEAYRKLKKDF